MIRYFLLGVMSVVTFSLIVYTKGATKTILAVTAQRDAAIKLGNDLAKMRNAE